MLKHFPHGNRSNSEDGLGFVRMWCFEWFAETHNTFSFVVRPWVTSQKHKSKATALQLVVFILTKGVLPFSEFMSISSVKNIRHNFQLVSSCVYNKNQMSLCFLLQWDQEDHKLFSKQERNVKESFRAKAIASNIKIRSIFLFQGSHII